jgi:hypothetical protein
MPLPQEFHELAAKVRNWGRWGDDDRIGTINHSNSRASRSGSSAAGSTRCAR